jgi:acyl carrier protein
LEPAALAASGAVPPLLRNLVRGRRPAAAAAAAGTVDRLANLPALQRHQLLLDLVRGEAAAVLGHSGAGAVPGQRAFRDLGFDSLTAVELRNRLRAATGLTLPAAVVFEYPTPVALARHLYSRIDPQATGGPAPALVALEGLEAALTASVPEPEKIAVLIRRLSALQWRLEVAADPTLQRDRQSDLESATDEEMFALIDTELSPQSSVEEQNTSGPGSYRV